MRATTDVRTAVTPLIDRTLTIGIAAWAGWTISLQLGMLLSLPLWMVLVVAVVVGSLAAAALPKHPSREIPPPPWSETLIVLGLALAAALAQLFVSRFDADDVFYLNRASWVGHAAHFTSALPTTDGMFSGGSFPYWMKATLPCSFEPAVGLVARSLGLSPSVVAHGVVAPLVAGWAVLIAWRLGRLFQPELGLSAVGGMLVFLLADGERNASLGNTTLFRASQGKAILLLIIIPWLWLLISENVRGRRTSLALLVGSVSAIGLSPTALIVVPLLLIGVVVTMPGSIRDRLCVVLPAGGYLASVGVVLALSGASTSSVDVVHVVPTSSGIVHYLFSGWASLGMHLFFLVVGMAAVRPVTARRSVAWVLAIVVLIISLNPVLRFLGAFSEGSVLWRLPWALPLGVLIGLGVSAIAVRFPRGLRLSGLVVLATVAASASGVRPVLRQANDVRLGFSLTDYPQEWRDSAHAFGEVAGAGVVIGPDWLNFAVAMTEPGLRPLWTRDVYVAHASSVLGERFMLSARRTLRSVWTEGAPAGDLASAVSRLGVRAVCVPPMNTHLFLELGFELRGEVGPAQERCVIMTRPELLVASGR